MKRLTRKELLVLLVEECSEVIQAATKCLRFGYDTFGPGDYGRNDWVLQIEAGELSAVMDELGFPLEASFIDGKHDKIERAMRAKELYGVRKKQNSKSKPKARRRSGRK